MTTPLFPSPPRLLLRDAMDVTPAQENLTTRHANHGPVRTQALYCLKGGPVMNIIEGWYHHSSVGQISLSLCR